MTRILVSGDSHSDINHLKSVESKMEKFDCDICYVVGDYGFWPQHKDGVKFLDKVSTLGFPVYFTAGNHEDWDTLNRHVNGRRMQTFIEVHPNSFYAQTGLKWEWDGVRFLSVGGAYSIDRRRRVKFISWFPDEVISEQDVDRCNLHGRAVDVILAHDSPACVDLQQPFMAQNGSPIDMDPDTTLNRHRLQQIVDANDPTLLVHGHWHMNYTQQCGPLKVIGLNCNATPDYFIVIDTEDFK